MSVGCEGLFKSFRFQGLAWTSGFRVSALWFQIPVLGSHLSIAIRYLDKGRSRYRQYRSGYKVEPEVG